MSSSHRSNRLAREVSPYLQQHAHNPVDWYPWGPEALGRAESEDKPVLLSVGYSACHWCHVMERESFDDAATAAFMNEHFVNIKVDREERPDLDQIYQPVVQLLSGRAGGWPLTVFLTPRREPFFAGTYFPPTDRHGMPSFSTVLEAVRDAYATRRDEVVRSAADLTEALRRVTSPSGDAVDVPADIVERAAAALISRYDETHGGFGTRPKFPNTMALDVLLRAHRASGDEDMLGRVMRALSAMRDGGIYDQLGGGFHRYSTDAEWLVPHFEKMLYDNALILRLAADAYRVTADTGLRETAEATVDYLVREMRDPGGGFYSSQDADSEGEEGRYFVWTPDEIDAVVTDRKAAAAVKLRFGVTPEGNFEGSGATVLHVRASWPEVASALAVGDDEARALVDAAVPMLLRARAQRVAPFRDEKVIAAWNGLVIGALAEASMAFDEPEWRDHALEALAFVRTRMWSDGRLRRIAKGDVVGGEAFLEDYGSIASAALDCYEASFDARCLELAREVSESALGLFQDEAGGGFFFAPDRDDLVVRAKDAFDNAVPSGTSSFCHALLRLHALTGEAHWLDAAEGTLRGLTDAALTQPFGFGHLLGAMDRYVQGSTQVVIVATKDDPHAEALARVVRRAYFPNRALVRVDPGEQGTARAPEGVPAGGVERATVYVCRGRTCSLPVTEPSALEELLSQ